MPDTALKRSPWTFVPLLYFMQALPVTLVQEVSLIVYKDLGIPNENITRWTSIIALPWSIKFLWGPLVDLNFTKRRWVVTMQGLLTAALMIAPFMLRTPKPFETSLAILLVSALFSATCDIATDGYYLLSLSREEQAAYVGFQSTFYRLGRLFCTGILVTVQGLLVKDQGWTATDGWVLVLVVGGAYYGLGWLSLSLDLKQPGLWRLLVRAIAGIASAVGIAVALYGLGNILGHAAWWLGDAMGSSDLFARFKDAGKGYSMSWVYLLLGGFGGLVCLALATGRTYLPKPDIDKPAVEVSVPENRANIWRTVLVIAAALFGYFTMNSVVRLGAHGISQLGPRFGWDLHGWVLKPEQISIEVIQLIVCFAGFAICVVWLKRSVAGTQLGRVFRSFFTQDRIFAVLSFLMFYRFGEAMVSKMAPLFLKDTLDKGGLAIPNDMLGQVNGVAGVIGIVIGGILGGWVVSKFGLKKAIWPLVLIMHLPNLLYVWASSAHPTLAQIYGVVFVDQFGYGFGFAAYFVVLQRIAQRGEFRTSHYAICTGLGAMFISVAGITSGILQAQWGYHGFFLGVIIATLPGMATLFFIPMDEKAPALS